MGETRDAKTGDNDLGLTGKLVSVSSSDKITARFQMVASSIRLTVAEPDRYIVAYKLRETASSSMLRGPKDLRALTIQFAGSTDRTKVWERYCKIFRQHRGKFYTVI